MEYQIGDAVSLEGFFGYISELKEGLAKVVFTVDVNITDMIPVERLKPITLLELQRQLEFVQRYEAR